MDQLIFASLSHTHYWYEVGMLKVPAVVGDHVVLSSEGVVLVSSPGTESSYPRPPPIVEHPWSKSPDFSLSVKNERIDAAWLGREGKVNNPCATAKTSYWQSYPG